MKTIPLTQGKFAIVDDDNEAKNKWLAHRDLKNGNYYAWKIYYFEFPRR
jgi:hypothetical protein